MDDLSEITKDSFFGGKIICYQNQSGYRFSVDAVLLSNFALHWKNATILDMGCGCSILGLILLYKNGKNILSIDGIEIQSGLSKLAQKNVSANSFSSKLKITTGDYRNIKSFFPPEHFSHIICNPPFYKIGSGRVNNNNEAFLARHQTTATIVDIASCISYSLKNKGTVSIIYPAELVSELLVSLLNKKIQPKRLRMAYSYPESKTANLVLVECIKNGGMGAKILPPLYLYERKNGSHTEEVKQMYLP